RRLREGGKRVVGVGSDSAGAALVQSCDRFETPAPPQKASRGRGQAPRSADPKLTDLVLTAFESVVGEDGSVGGSKLLQAVQRRMEGPCPFGPGNEAMTPPETLAFRDGGEANGTGWRLRVVPNKFPALGARGNAAPIGHVLRHMEGIGAHEVVIEVPQHGA